jgi:hypothetical protein
MYVHVYDIHVFTRIWHTYILVLKHSLNAAEH